jgi:micrococcal nuclease|tara:strand:+ start:280 stop:651 length:372 start_codon:yes stop_codon:yes gene_type:complete
MPYEYRCTLRRIVDADTLDCDIDLGFGVIYAKQRIRFEGIDTPESRTRNKAEKALGLAAKARTKELIPKKFVMQTIKDDKGKFGRILGRPFTEDGQDVCQLLIQEGHAREYYGGTKIPWVEEE